MADDPKRTILAADPDVLRHASWSQSNALLEALLFDPARERETPENRSVFVGYPYALPRDDYRGVFAEVGEEHGVSFLFADEQLTTKHILEKIVTMMRSAAFSLFDITHWNPNVALELGIAYGRGLDFYILFDPTKGNTDVLSDVRGIDRIQYKSFNQLKEHLSKLMRDQFGSPEQSHEPEPGTVVAQFESIRDRIPDLLAQDPGQTMGGIASSLRLPIDLAQTLVRPLVGSTLETRGVRRGTRYYRAGEAPPEEDDDDTSGDDAIDVVPEPGAMEEH